MIPLPNLDDKTFNQLVEEAKKLIPLYSPEWTDYNLHDPGITIIELFAWLTEMQRYYLDRVPEGNYKKFLKLLGRNIRSYPTRSKTMMFFSGTEKTGGIVDVPGAVRLSDGETVFETSEPLRFLNISLEKLFTIKVNSYIDNMPSNRHEGITFYGFGEKPEINDIMYIGFDIKGKEKPTSNWEFGLYFDIFDEYEDSFLKQRDSWKSDVEVLPSVKLKWEYFCGEWKKACVQEDGTGALYHRGRLLLRLPSRPEKTVTFFSDDRKRYWIRCILSYGAYETAPRIKNIAFNSVPAEQCETEAETILIPKLNKSLNCFKLNTFQSIYGQNLLQVMAENGGWVYWDQVSHLSSSRPEDTCFVIDKGTVPRLYFGNGIKGKRPPAGKNKVRLISYTKPLPEFTGNGLPGQVFELRKAPVISQEFILQVLEPGDNIWFDWIKSEDFHASKPNDRHFVLDSQTGEITFGDGKKGLIPQAGSKIRIIACKLGGGEEGNVEAHTINRILSPFKDAGLLKVENITAAEGGSRPENIHEAILSAGRDMKETYTAVTCEDYEELALNTPGIRVARAKAIPLYSPYTEGYPDNVSPASVTVVVVPDGKSGKPVPGREFLMNVKKHLDTVRLVTTEVFVVGPDYVEVSVGAKVVFKEGYIPDEKRVIARLDEFLSPLGNGLDFKGWPFGRTVYLSEIYEVIENMEGVDYIEGVRLSAKGQSSGNDPKGNIKIGPNCLTVPGCHMIEATGC